MKFDLKKLYALLPALYRIRDAEIGLRLHEDPELGFLTEDIDKTTGPLKAILSIIADEVENLEENLDQLYDDLFIETCAEWVVPYIGDLVGNRRLLPIPGSDFSHRAEVANTVRYRRRKGTVPVIEQLGRDLTGWDANVVEYFQFLATTQYMNHLRPGNLAVSRISKDPWVNTKDDGWKLLEYSNTPFDEMPKTIDVRNIKNRRGKYNIHNVGVFLWRIRAFSISNAPAHKVDENRYTFDILGKNVQLYNKPFTEETITQLADRMNVAMPISRRELHEDLGKYYGNNKSIHIYLNGNAILPDAICVCNLSDKDDNSGQWINMPKNKTAIDPVLGRIAFPPDTQMPPVKREVHVTYHYGFSIDMGAGEYNREAFIGERYGNEIKKISDGNSIQSALDDLAGTGGIVEITDNEIYEEDLAIIIAEGKTIEIRAADGRRPTVIIPNGIKIAAEEGSSVIFNGLLIAGHGIVNSKNCRLESLKIIHCTLDPSPNHKTKLIWSSSQTTIEISHSIVGELLINDESEIKVFNSIVDASEPSETAIMGSSEKMPCGKLFIENSTIIGRVYTRVMSMASNTIFFAEASSQNDPPVRAQRTQEGCVRFSYFPEKSHLPRKFRCQPATSGEPNRVRPVFSSLTFGEADYALLSLSCAKEILEGADDDAEMGVYHDLYQPQRTSNLHTRLEEYLPFGMKAGIFYAS